MKLIIKCGTLFDATGAEPTAKQCVVIQDGKIAEVISFADFDRRADVKGIEVVDASSHWVMPGLINAHDHRVFRDLIGPVIQTMRAPASKKMCRGALRDFIPPPVRLCCATAAAKAPIM